MAPGFEIKRGDELETLEGSGGAEWLLARRSLGVENFGINLVKIPAGGSIVAHDETESGQIEVYGILEGEGVFEIEGSEHAAPAGTWVRLDPEVKRNILNRSDAPLTAILIGVPRDTGYEAPGWA
jgi:quercetin dioxygenase-like cupin family protein